MTGAFLCDIILYIILFVEDYKIVDVIAHIRTDFPEKFGIPRQSGIVEELKGYIEFEPMYRNPDAVKGLLGYEYIWLLWKFDDVERQGFNATVKPPRLGGNTHMGVFATRSPYRPNPIGLSSVKLEDIRMTENGPVICVSGIDLKDNTAIFDIKPYLPYTDSHPDARAGFADDVIEYHLDVVFPDEMLSLYPEDKREAVVRLLSQDPRPSYHSDEDRRYGVSFAGYDVHFTVSDGVLTVFEMKKL